jgi:hypothetical protein
MPTSLDLQMRPVATDLINEYGKPIVVRKTVSDHDPATGKVTHTHTDISTKGVIEGYSAKTLMATGGTGTSLVQVGDLSVTIPAEAFGDGEDPEPADTIFFDSTSGAEHTIVTVEPVYTGELVGIYICQIRGGSSD